MITPCGGGGGGGGIQYVTDPQTGAWLLVSTTGSHDGLGVAFYDTSGGFLFYTVDGSYTVQSQHADVSIQSGTDMSLDAGEDLNLSGGATVNIGAPSVSLFSSGAELIVDIGAGFGLMVRIGGQEMFRVDPDGSLHGLIGQSLTFDIP